MGFKSTDFPSSRSAEAVQTTPKQMAKPAIRLEGPGRVAESVDCWPFGELGKSGVGGFSTARLDDQSAKFEKDFFGTRRISFAEDLTIFLPMNVCWWPESGATFNSSPQPRFGSKSASCQCRTSRKLNIGGSNGILFLLWIPAQQHAATQKRLLKFS